jgi:hypothetical protein
VLNTATFAVPRHALDQSHVVKHERGKYQARGQCKLNITDKRVGQMHAGDKLLLKFCGLRRYAKYTDAEFHERLIVVAKATRLWDVATCPREQRAVGVNAVVYPPQRGRAEPSVDRPHQESRPS